MYYLGQKIIINGEDDDAQLNHRQSSNQHVNKITYQDFNLRACQKNNYSAKCFIYHWAAFCTGVSRYSFLVAECSFFEGLDIWCSTATYYSAKGFFTKQIASN